MNVLRVAALAISTLAVSRAGDVFVDRPIQEKKIISGDRKITDPGCPVDGTDVVWKVRIDTAGKVTKVSQSENVQQPNLPQRVKDVIKRLIQQTWAFTPTLVDRKPVVVNSYVSVHCIK